jgi:hypothetical protein
MKDPNDADRIRDTRNLARTFVENTHIAWVLLAGTVAWGLYGYFTMPQRKDPFIPPKQAMVLTSWPGASAEQIENLVTRPIEKVLATNSNVSRIESTSRSNVSSIVFTLADELTEVGPVLDDIGGRLSGAHNLPNGTGPIQYVRDFGDTATLMLTVASPRAGAVEIAMRAEAIRKVLARVRSGVHDDARDRAAVILCYPAAIDRRSIDLAAAQYLNYLRARIRPGCAYRLGQRVCWRRSPLSGKRRGAPQNA